MRDLMFVEGPEYIIEQLNAKFGKMPLLINEAGDVEEIKVNKAEISYIPGEVGYVDILTYRLIFDVTFHNKIKKTISTLIFSDVRLGDANKSIFDLDTDPSWSQTDTGDFYVETEEETSQEFIDFANLLVHLGLMEILENTNSYLEWYNLYKSTKEAHYYKKYSPWIPYAAEFQYFDEEKMHILLENGFPIYVRIEDMNESIHSKLISSTKQKII